MSVYRTLETAEDEPRMPVVIRPDGAEVHFDVTGQGFPVLLLAPGGVSSQISAWQTAAFDPREVLAEDFTVIAMDQRHAGASRAPLEPFSYGQMLHDQLAVLNDLGIDQAHVIGGCIGVAYALKLMDDAPARIAAAVLQDPVGLDETNSMDTFYSMFNETIRVTRSEGIEAVVAAARQNPRFSENHAGGPWSQRIADQPGFDRTLVSLGRERYIALVVDFRDGIWPWQSKFVSVNEVAISRMTHPMLVLPGSDAFHPTGIADAIVATAPNAQALTVDCRSAAKLAATVDRVREFLLEHTP